MGKHALETDPGAALGLEMISAGRARRRLGHMTAVRHQSAQKPHHVGALQLWLGTY